MSILSPTPPLENLIYRHFLNLRIIASGRYITPVAKLIAFTKECDIFQNKLRGLYGEAVNVEAKDMTPGEVALSVAKNYSGEDK